MPDLPPSVGRPNDAEIGSAQNARFGAADADFERGRSHEATVPVDASTPARWYRRRWVSVVGVSLGAIGLVSTGLLAGRWMSGRQDTEVWYLTRGVAEGTRVRVSDFEKVTLRRPPSSDVVQAERESAPGGVATRDLPRGALLRQQFLVEGLGETGGDALLTGLALPAGAAPAGLQAGDDVRVLRLPLSQELATKSPGAREVASDVTVYSAASAADGQQLVTLVLEDAEVAELIAGLAAYDAVALQRTFPRSDVAE